MIDRDQLTEARRRFGMREQRFAELDDNAVIAKALGLLLAFPTDEMVVAAQLHIEGNGYLEAKAVLAAVRQVMLGEKPYVNDGNDPDGYPW